MFGKPEWFRDKTFGWGLTPITWQGWLYTLAWMGVIAGPFVLLLSRENPLGAGTWMTAMIAALVWDVWMIKRARQAALKPPVKNEPVLYIGDDEQLSTKNLDLQLRR
jgi:hypothetical protein